MGEKDHGGLSFRENTDSVRVREIGRASSFFFFFLRERTKRKTFYQYFKRKIVKYFTALLFLLIDNILFLTKYFTAKQTS